MLPLSNSNIITFSQAPRVAAEVFFLVSSFHLLFNNVFLKAVSTQELTDPTNLPSGIITLDFSTSVFILDVLRLQLVYYSCVVKSYNIKTLGRMQILVKDSYQVLGLLDMCKEGSRLFEGLNLICQVR